MISNFVLQSFREIGSAPGCADSFSIPGPSVHRLLALLPGSYGRGVQGSIKNDYSVRVFELVNRNDKVKYLVCDDAVGNTVQGMKTVELYTDGACRGNPGPGGFGAVLIYGAHRKELSAGFRWTTNNRMELIALIKALLILKEPCRLEIVSDSKYLLDALREGRIPKWKRNGWRTASRQPVLNRDLWQELDRLSAMHEQNYRWVKGHGLTPENNRCDELAVVAANSENLLIDEAYEAHNPFQDSREAPLFAKVSNTSPRQTRLI